MDIPVKISDQEYEHLIKMLFDRTQEGILVVSAEQEDSGRILMANEPLARMHGYSIEEIQGMTISDLHTPEESESVQESWNKMLAGEWLHTQHKHVKKDGSRFMVDTDTGIVSLGGQRCLISLERDFTQQQRADKALKVCTEKLSAYI